MPPAASIFVEAVQQLHALESIRCEFSGLREKLLSTRVSGVMRLRAMSAGVTRRGAVLAAVAVLAAGCSGDGAPPLVEPFDEPEQQAPLQPEVDDEPSAQPEPSVDDAAPVELAGMYEWDPEADSEDAGAFGILEIDPPCVYINEIDPAGQTVRMPDGKLLRIFVRLPQALVRFDAETNSIWVDDEGPMATGEGVTLGGGYSAEAFGRRVFEDECSANASFTASLMAPGLDHMLGFGWDDPPVESRELTNMFDWDPAGGYHDASVEGILEIVPACTYVTDELWVGCVAIEPDPETEPRCVYVTRTDGGQAALASDGAPIRTLVRLSRPLTRYDPDTGELWVGDHGPMTSGDQVIVTGSVGWAAGEAPREEPFEGHCAAHRSFWAASMHPIGSELADADTGGEKSPPLAEMFPWDPKQDVAWYGLDGTLAIETPCVYIDRIDDSPSWLPGRTGGDPTRLLLRLAQPLVRFDEDTGELWVGPDGPFIHGDKVLLGGGPNAIPGRDAALQVYEGGCSAHEVFWTLNVDSDSP